MAKKIIEDYFTGPHQIGDMEYKSPYRGVLIDARSCSGRHIETGEIVSAENTGSWAGAVLYLILIDHIGGSFKKYRTPRKKGIPDFISALENFTQLSNDEIFALYALRCSLLHEYSLTNINKKYKNLTHNFVLHTGDIFIELSKKKWSGRRVKNVADYQTRISLKELGNFVEVLHQTLINLNKNNNLIALDPRRLTMISYKIN